MKMWWLVFIGINLYSEPMSIIHKSTNGVKFSVFINGILLEKYPKDEGKLIKVI